MIYGERIKQARELKLLTQAALAEVLGVARSTIAHIETGRITPSTDMLEAIAAETDVLPSFFMRQPIEEFPLGSLTYRRRSSVKASERNRAYQCTKLYIEHMRIMGSKLSLPVIRLPKVNGDPRASARMARVVFGAEADRPIPNIINLLERHGIVVLGLPFRMEKIDAFATWAMMDEWRPIISLSAEKPGDRLRFSVAHELAHIVLHHGEDARIPDLEKQANEFAGEFLLPSHLLKDTVSPQLTLTQAARLKLRWGVSMQAIIKQARDVGIITDRRYHYLFEQLGRLGWRTQEPATLDIPVERPRSYKKMTEMLYGPFEERERLATELGIKPKLASALLSQYAPAFTPANLTDTEDYTVPSGIAHRN